jgi:fructosamine-3-kinase
MADAEGRPWLIDPSAYGGHREIDLAMLRLFGAPSERIFDTYQERAPLAEGWAERVALYQLAPLLVHAVLFGGSYEPPSRGPPPGTPERGPLASGCRGGQPALGHPDTPDR